MVGFFDKGNVPSDYGRSDYIEHESNSWNFRGVLPECLPKIALIEGWRWVISKSKKIHSKKPVDKPSRSQWCHYEPFFQRRLLQESISGGDGIERKIIEGPILGLPWFGPFLCDIPFNETAWVRWFNQFLTQLCNTDLFEDFWSLRSVIGVSPLRLLGLSWVAIGWCVFCKGLQDHRENIMKYHLSGSLRGFEGTFCPFPSFPSPKPSRKIVST